MEEKAKLQELVKAFARRAVQGVRCSYVDPERGAQMPATYCVDKRLQKLIVTTEFGQETMCELGAIQEVYSVDDGEQRFSPHVLEVLGRDNRERLILLEYAGGG